MKLSRGLPCGLTLGLVLIAAIPGAGDRSVAAAPDEPAAVKEAGGFGDARKGDVPEGAAQMITDDAERAIQLGLSWLSRNQNADGSYGTGTYRGNIAVTSLAGLAFMASGSSPGRGPYGAAVDKALTYVMDNTSPSGFIAVAAASTHGPMYSHGFGDLVPGRGLRHDASPRDPRKAPESGSPDHRHAEQRGGLAVSAGPARRRPVGDRLPDQRPPRRPQRRPVRSQRDGRELHPVLPAVAEPRWRLPVHAPGGRKAFPRSAAGLVALYSAAVYDAKEIEAGTAYLRQFMPEIKLGSRYSHYFYGHYYAAQAMWIRGGEDWNAWYPSIRDELIRRQSTTAGFWADSICNEYGTAMALIILQMPNNYLPIFQR